MTWTTRRGFLLGALAALASSACLQVPERVVAPAAPTSTPELDAWTSQAQAMLADGLQSLRIFEVFAAFRISTTPASDRRTASELVWDPPTGADWDEATHTARGLHSRAEQLFQAITTSQTDPNAWRQQRALADLAHDIGGLGDALARYRDRLDVLRPGDGAGALGLLDDAWSAWEGVAGRLGSGRAELIGCA
jgi:hypothetical protein